MKLWRNIWVSFLATLNQVDLIIILVLGTIIQGRQDNSNARIFFTQSYITRCRAKIRGAVCGLTKPTPVSAILSQCSLQERIFHSLLNEISSFGSVTSRLPGAQYIPHIYNKTQV